MWLYEAVMGYHQLVVTPKSQEKLAFQGLNTIRWTYTIMSFVPANSPTTFIMMIHDVNSVWKETTSSMGLSIGTNVDNKIIINDIINWAQSFDPALQYIECQLHMAKAYCLTLRLIKSHFFPKRLSLLESMFSRMETAWQSSNTCSCKAGLHNC